MVDFFFEYGLFALKSLTLVALVTTVGLMVFGGITRSFGQERDHFHVVKLNDRVKEEQELLTEALADDLTNRMLHKHRKASEKRERKARKKELASAKGSGVAELPNSTERRRVFVLDFDGDIAATATASLRRELSAVLAMKERVDEVVLRLESSGGMVHSYGFAASQLARVKAKGITLTVCVDKVAASGGYMMACTADRLLAAPFAVIGSIGVVAQIPNFHRLLKKHDVDIELHTAGEHKRTLTVLGENTPEGRQKFRENLDVTHALFKEHIAEMRPQLDVNKVATGDIWLGKKALTENLIDELSTSDDYIAGLIETADVLELKYEKKNSLQDRMASSLEGALESVISRWWGRATTQTPGS